MDRRVVACLAAAVLLCSACRAATGGAEAGGTTPAEPSPATVASAPEPDPEPDTRLDAGPDAAPAPPPAPTVAIRADDDRSGATTHAPPAYRASVDEIDTDTAARLHASWRPGCPVGLEDLRLVTLSHWGFDGEAHTGELVVHRDHALPTVEVFEQLFLARFPIEQMRLVDEFDGDDDASMAANNTSAFNCRPATGSSRWSEHAYGLAIDLNPVQNPFVTGSGRVYPPTGAAHIDRDPTVPGLITDGDAVVTAFAAIGWQWGGHWTSSKDYQHFSASGR